MICVGIDIGTSSIKIAEIETEARGYNVNRFQIFPLSTDPNKDTEIEVLDVLRTIAAQYDPSSTRFVLGLDARNVSLRRRLFPFKERHKILKSLAFELEEDIPFSQNDAIFDAKITRYLDNSADLIAVACPKVNIATVVKLCEDCNINLEVLSINGLALNNLFENWYDPPPTLLLDTEEQLLNRSVEIILEIGYSTTTLLVLKDGYLLELRSFDWGGKSIATALAKKYSLHIVEAKKELEAKSFILLNNVDVTADQVTFSDTIKDSVNYFTQQLNLTLLELKSEYSINVTRASYTGGVSQIKNLGAYLTQKTEIPFSRLNLLVSNPNVRTATNKQDGLVAGTALGLAIEGIKKPKNPALNLLKDDFAKQSQNLRVLAEKWAPTLKIAAVAFVFLIAYGIIRENTALEMADKASETLKIQAKKVAGLKGRKANERGVRKFIKKQQRIQKNKQLAEDLNLINSSLDILLKVSRSTPRSGVVNLNIKRFIVSNEEVQLEGEVKNSSMLKNLSKALKALSKNGKVQSVPSQIKAQRGWNTFGFRFNINRQDGGH